MPELNWAIICLGYEDSKRTGGMSIFDEGLSLHSEQFPCKYDGLCVVARWSGIPEEKQFIYRVDIRSSSGSEIIGTSGDMLAETRVGGSYTRDKFLGVPFNEPGNYRIDIVANGIVFQTIFLPVFQGKTGDQIPDNLLYFT